MFQVELGSDDFYKDSDFVKISAVVRAIARILLSNGSPNRFQAERDAWPYIHTGIATENLHPLAPKTLFPLSINDYGNGIVPFAELVEWGRWTKRFDFVVASPAAKVEAAPDAKNSNEKPPLQQQFQEREILRVIEELSYEPKNLPQNKPGKAGVKAEVRKKLSFPVKVFDKAWERLKANVDIQYAE